MFLNSRYATGVVDTDVYNGKTVYLVEREWGANPTYTWYQWKPGDRLDMLATALGIPREDWFQIMDLNPEITSPTLIKPGMSIRVPV